MCYSPIFLLSKMGSYYSNMVSFDLMIIYVKGVSSNTERIAPCKKRSILTQNAMDLETYKSIDADIWLGDWFGDDTKHNAAIFEIFIFYDFLGIQSSNFRYFDKLLDFDPWKIAKNQNFKNRHIAFLYYPQIYL